MKRLSILSLLILLLFQSLLFAQQQENQLTHEMTPEEMLRKHEIGRDFTPTDPPLAPVRMVAEFEEMQMVLIRYPFGIPMALIKEMAEDCVVLTIVANASEETTVRNQYQAYGVNMNNCEFVYAPTDSYWTRDYGPWFVVNGNNEVGVCDFIYNRPRPNDDNIPNIIATYLGVERYGMALTTAGGNYMCDGIKIAASSDLIWEENSQYSHSEIDTMVWDYLGIRKYNVLPDPLGEYIKHIDCWGKFLDINKVLIGQVPVSDYRYEDFEYIANYFAMQTSSYGTPYKVYRVYTPGDSPYTPYTNSLILNKKVFVPITGSQYDDEALQVYQEAMPGYEVHGIMSNNWVNTDALHCRAIGIADIGMLYVEHNPILGQKNFQFEWDLSANIITYSNYGLITDSLLCWYQVDSTGYQLAPLIHSSGYNYKATIPFVEPGSKVQYYLHAVDYSGRKKDHPYIGRPDPHEFKVKYATDVVIDPDTLVYLTTEDMVLGKTFNIYNFTSGDVIINEIENFGYNLLPFYIDPWTMTPPDTMDYGDTISLNVKISLPVDQITGYIITDTLDIYTEYGHQKVILKIDSDLLSGMGNSPSTNSDCTLESVVPNPFSNHTQITFSMAEEGSVSLSVYNLNGQMVRLIKEGKAGKGSQYVNWDGTNDSGISLPGGIYFIRLSSGDSISVKKVVLLK